MGMLEEKTELLQNAMARLNKQIENNKCALDNAYNAVELAILNKHTLFGKLQELNAEMAKHERHIHRKLCLDAKIYMVKEGDTLSDICIFLFGPRNIQSNVMALARANKIRDPNKIRPGQRLIWDKGVIIEAQLNELLPA